MIRTLEHERSFYRLFLVVAAAVGIGIGMRTPYTLAASQAQIDYRYAFLPQPFRRAVPPS